MKALRRGVLRTAAVVLCLACGGSYAGLKTVTWFDAPNDQVPVGDVVSAQLTFDDVGAWTADWWADPNHPFTGNARFNLNLFDTRLGSLAGAKAPQVSLDWVFDFGGATTTEFSYSGQTAYLASWKIGDTISTGNVTNFESGVVGQNPPYGRDKLLTSAPVVQSVPEPETGALLLLGVGMLLFLKRRK